MGCGGSSNNATPERTEKNTISILILGVSGCGKSTFAKQMKIISQSGFLDFEVDNYKKIVLKNLGSGLHELLNVVLTSGSVDDDNENAAQFFKQNPNVEWNPENIELAKKVWEDKAVLKTWESVKYSVHYTHLDYYMENIDRITEGEYIPTNEDIVRSRQYTIGASTTLIYIDKFWWRFIDVGGQTPERQKWAAIVQDTKINAMIYFVALDDYATESNEQKGKTRMDVSKEVWAEVMNSELFKRDTTILFLNKYDLFEKQIKSKREFKRFKKTFKDFDGENDPEDAAMFIKDQFTDIAISDEDDGQVYQHLTCAIDTEQMTIVWNILKENVIKERLKTAGFIYN